MNRQEIEKKFDEKFLEDFGWWKCVSPIATMWEIKSFFFDEILPEVLRDLIWNKIEMEVDLVDYWMWVAHGSNWKRKEIILQAKEKYNINL